MFTTDGSLLLADFPYGMEMYQNALIFFFFNKETKQRSLQNNLAWCETNPHFLLLFLRGLHANFCFFRAQPEAVFQSEKDETAAAYRGLRTIKYRRCIADMATGVPVNGLPQT